MRIWREATERGGGAAGRRFSRTIIFVYLLLRKLFTPLSARPRASASRAVSRAVPVPPRADTRVRVWPSPVSTPLTTECHVPLRRLTLSECSDPRPGSQYSELRRQTTSHTHDRRVRTYTSQQSRQRRAPLPRFGGMWPHHPFATQCAADPTVRSSSSASMVTLQSFSKCIGFAPRRPKLRTGQNEAAERIRQ